MIHVVARAVEGTLLFHDWVEALALWRRLVESFPTAKAICLMPNHVHVITDDPSAKARMSALMSGYARWRTNRRGHGSACWQTQPDPTPIADAKHLRRTIRYVLLNPCRAGLASDPLAWPLSTHRDLVGFGDPALKQRDPEGFHAYVSSDPTTALTGTLLPGFNAGRAPLSDIWVAVGAVLRRTPEEARGDADARRLGVWAAVHLGPHPVGAMAAELGIGRARVYDLQKTAPARLRVKEVPYLSAIVRAVGDRRFPALDGPRRPSWAAWRLG